MYVCFMFHVASLSTVKERSGEWAKFGHGFVRDYLVPKWNELYAAAVRRQRGDDYHVDTVGDFLSKQKVCVGVVVVVVVGEPKPVENTQPTNATQPAVLVRTQHTACCFVLFLKSKIQWFSESVRRRPGSCFA